LALTPRPRPAPPHRLFWLGDTHTHDTTRHSIPRRFSRPTYMDACDYLALSHSRTIADSRTTIYYSIDHSLHQSLLSTIFTRTQTRTTQYITSHTHTPADTFV
jgi:hypothetical protein